MAIHLALTAADLVTAVKPFLNLKLRGLASAGEALFGYKNGYLRIEPGGIAGTAPAQGVWPGEARLSASFVVGLRAWLPASGNASLSVEAGKLAVRAGSLTLEKECRWETTERPPIQLPMNAELRDLARIAVSHSPEEIERAGASVPVSEAKLKMDALLEKAAKQLGPLGVAAADVRELVLSKLRSSE